MQTSEKRLDELEIKVSYQEDLVQELNAIISNQQKSIDRLENSLKLISERINELSVSLPGSPVAEEKPPHY